LPSEKNFFTLINESNKLLYFNSAMGETLSKGRPHGGTRWAINSNFKTISNEVIDNSINIVTIKVNGLVINLIGVYLMFNNNSNKNLNVYENQLATIFSLSNNMKEKRKSILFAEISMVISIGIQTNLIKI
jgi:hypothetical protein